MPTNSDDHDEQVVVPPNALDMRTLRRNNNNNNNNNIHVLNIYDHLFYDLFYKASLLYARIIPKSVRRVVEFLFLLEAVLSFFVLVYVHMNYIRLPVNCLDHVKDIWPRNGILRVEVIRRFHRSHAEQTGTINELFTIEKSYEREYKLKRMNTSEENASFSNHFTKTVSPVNNGEFDIEPPTEELVENKLYETNSPKSNIFNYLPFTNNISSKEIIYENYIVEYSLESKFLLLSPKSRNQLLIPVMLVTLEPTQNKCFGNSVGQFLLEYFLGYNDLLISSIKSLSIDEQNKGFLRNVMTERFDTSLNSLRSRVLYIGSFIIMFAFTSSLSIFFRYSHFMIFISRVRMMHPISIQDFLYYRVTPISIILISLYMIVVRMSKTFYEVTMTCYIILIIWAADLYYTVCNGFPITKKHWLKFFYVYHFSFFAYCIRFNGQNINLAFLCSWLWIQHSMIYFYHHYELPFLLLQAQL